MTDTSEPHGVTEWKMPSWVPMAGVSIASAIFACGLFWGVSHSKWDKFDDADRRMNARVLKLEESVQAMRNDRAREYAGLKISVGRIMAGHVSKLGDKLDETIRKVAVQTEAFNRFEAESRAWRLRGGPR